MSGGYDTSWARRKLDRARAHLAELEQASAAWLEPTVHPLRVVIAEDGRSVELVLTFADPPPLDQWSLIAGDCVHNIRSALDVFIWANSRDLPGHQLRLVAYPILPYADEENDPDASDLLEDQPRRRQRLLKAKVAGLPDPLRSRVLNNVRWASLPHDGDVIRHQRLPLIDELDNIDKHRLALDLRSDWSAATWDLSAWGPDGESIRIDPDWDRASRVSMGHRDRIVMAVARPDGPIARIQGAASVVLDLRVVMLDRSLVVLRTLGDFIEVVDGLLDVLGAPIPVD